MVAKFQRTRTVSGTTASGGSDKAPRIDQLVEMFQPKERVWYQMRLVGPMFSYAFHWIEIASAKGKNGVAKFTKQCLSYSDEAESMDSTCDCPYCELLGKAPTVHYYQNIILRKRQESAPKNAASPNKEEAKSGFKDMDSDSWTPVQVLRLPVGAVSSLRSLGELNKHGKTGSKKPYDVSDEQYGCDVMYMFDNTKQGSGKHTFQKADHTPLEDDELEFLLYNIEDIVVPESEKSAQSECDRLDGKVLSEDEDGGHTAKGSNRGRGHDDDEDDTPKRKGKSKPSVDDDEDEPKGKRSREPEYEPEVGDSVAITDSDDEVTTGVVESVTARMIVLEDGEKYKRADVTIVQAKSSKKSKPSVDDDEYTPEEGDLVNVTDEDDEVTSGTVVLITSKLVKIEDSEGDEHKFKLDEVTVEKAKPAGKKRKPVEDDEPAPKGKHKPAADDSDDDEYTPEEGDKVKVTDEDDEVTTGTVIDLTRLVITVEDSDGDEHKFKRADVTVAKAKASPTKRKAAEYEDEPAPRKRSTKITDEDADEAEKPAAKRRKPAEDDDDDTPPPKKRKPVSDDEDDAPPPKKRKPAVDDSDDEDDAKPAPKKRKPGWDD